MDLLRNKSTLKLSDLSYNQVLQVIDLSQKLKILKSQRKEISLLQKKNIVSIFETESTRTRCAFDVASSDQCARITHLDERNSHFGRNEAIQDSVRVLKNMYDAVQYRGNQQKIEQIDKYANIPVWNGLTDAFHPTQVLADLLTMREMLPNEPFHQMKLSYVGNARSNVGNSLLESALMTGINLRIVAPRCLWTTRKTLDRVRSIHCNEKMHNVRFTENPNLGVLHTDFIYTDAWISMKEDKASWMKRISILRNYQVDAAMLSKTHNPNTKILHCLPSVHRKIDCTEKLRVRTHHTTNGFEITNAAFESHKRLIFQQSENRLHTIKALMILTLVS